MRKILLKLATLCAVFIFSACSSGGDSTHSFIDDITGNYSVVLPGNSEGDVEKTISVTKAGDAAININIPNFAFDGYTFGSINVTCTVTEEDGEIHFAGSTAVTATRATYNATCNIEGYINGDEIDFTIIIISDEIPNIINMHILGEVIADIIIDGDIDNEEEQEGELVENMPMLEGEWTAIEHNGQPIESPYSMIMNIGRCNKFESHTHMRNADGTITTETIKGEYIWQGWNTARFSIVVDNHEYTYFIYKRRYYDSGDNGEKMIIMETMNPNGIITVWKQSLGKPGDWLE